VNSIDWSYNTQLIHEALESFCNILKLFVARFKRRDRQFVQPSAIGTAQQHKILKHIHLSECQRGKVCRDASFKENLTELFILLSLFGPSRRRGFFRTDRGNR
jgi:hypothetical protein